MELLYNIVLVFHFLGWAVVLGGTVVNIRNPRIAPGVLHGAITALVAGIVLVGLASGPLDRDVDHVKIAVKLVVSLAVTLMVMLAARKDSPSRGEVGGIAALTVVNIAVAAIW